MRKTLAILAAFAAVVIGAIVIWSVFRSSEDSPVAATQTPYGWEFKPVVVNIQVDLEEEGDQVAVSGILDAVEKHDWRTTVFATGEFASSHPDVLANVQSRGHQIGVHGWQKEENLSLLDYQGQLALIGKSFTAVRAAVSKPEAVVDFKPQGYKFNDDTIRALQDFGARSINGLFPCQGAFCSCQYAQSIGKITFPYPVTTEFWAVPISTFETESGELLLDDAQLLDSGATSAEYLSYLIQTFRQHGESKDPLVIVVHASVTGQDAGALDALAQFLTHVENNNGKVATLDSIRHHTAYITNFDASGPASAAVGEQVSLGVNYTSSLYCPKYRFRAYGRYPGEEWKLLNSDCQFVGLGDHSFNMQATIPKPPEGENVYTVRVVGTASFGSCDPSDPNWPTYDSYDVMDEIAITVEPRCLPVPGRTIGSHDGKIDLVFVPDDDYGSNPDLFLPTFLGHVNDEITQRLGGVAPVSSNLNRFNFYYTKDQGHVHNDTNSNCAEASSLPDGLIHDCAFADAFVVLHATEFGDCSTVNGHPNIYSAEGPIGNSFIHESGHGIFGLADEYDGTTHYFQPNPAPNIWSTETACRSDATSEGWNPNGCQQFTSRQGGWWKLGTTEYIMLDGTRFANGFGPAGERRINWVLHQYVDPPQSGKALDLELNISADQLSLLGSAVIDQFPPNYLPGTYSFTATVLSLHDELLGQYGFGDPRVRLAEQGAVITPKDNVDFSLTLPYYHDGKTVSVSNSTGQELLTVDISQYATGIISGVVTRQDGQPVAGALVQVAGASHDSALTGEDGRYEVAGLEPGDYTVTVTPPALANLMLAWTSIAVPAGETVTVDFTLQQAGSVAGTVTDAAGAPVTGVHLYFSGYEPPRYQTDDQGNYVIAGVDAGHYTLNIDAPGYQAWSILVNGSYVGRSGSVDIDVTLDQTVKVDFIQAATGPMECVSYTSSDVPKAIIDYTTTTSTLQVGDSFTLADVNVGPLNITHTYDGDLNVFLISPQGTRVELFTGVGSYGDNFTNTVLDDGCATPIASGTAPFTGCYQPEGSLSALDGQSSAGVWTLEIYDHAGADTGTLQSWQLALCSAVDSDGDGCTWKEEAYGAPPPNSGSTCGDPAHCFSDSASYDFFDVPVPVNRDPTPNGVRNRAVNLLDVLAVLKYVPSPPPLGTLDTPNANGVAYNTIKGSCDPNGDTVPDTEGMCYDRTISPGPNPPWDAGPPDGAISLLDVIAALKQYGLDCSGPP